MTGEGSDTPWESPWMLIAGLAACCVLVVVFFFESQATDRRSERNSCTVAAETNGTDPADC